MADEHHLAPFARRYQVRRCSSEPSLAKSVLSFKDQNLIIEEMGWVAKELKLKSDLNKLTCENSKLRQLLKDYLDDLRSVMLNTPRSKSSSSSSGGKDSRSSDSTKSPESMEYLELLEDRLTSLMIGEEDAIVQKMDSLKLQHDFDTMMAEATGGEELMLNSNSSNAVRVSVACPYCSSHSVFELLISPTSLQGETTTSTCQVCGHISHPVLRMI